MAEEKEKSVEELKKDLEAMENYVRILNHDLRTPLSNIVAFSGLIQDGDYPIEQIKEFNSLINDAGKRTLDMMESYLALEKVERGQAVLSKQLKNIGYVLSKIKKSYSELKNKGYILNIELNNPKDGVSDFGIVEKVIQIDKVLFSSLVTNLLKNSIEATSASKTNEKIVVNLFEENGFFCLGVSNAGEVPEDIRENLFKKFSTSKKDGTGLGLYSAKLIAKAHGGSIEYTPLEGGTRFTVRIPF